MANEVGELLRSWDIPDDIIGTFESKERVMHKLFDIKGFFFRKPNYTRPLWRSHGVTVKGVVPCNSIQN